MNDLTAFLRARYDQAHAALLAQRNGHPGNCLNYPGQNPEDYDEYETCHLHIATAESSPYRDIEFGLADIDAKRQILTAYEDRPAESDSQLHARFAHPAWEYRTTTGPRKTWDDVDTPPLDENGDPDPSWERNRDAGRPGEGWERFDYTEKSYWRRLRPEGQERRPEIPRMLRLLALPYANQPGYQETWRP
ncbi:DUF6221 family protein [Streptomyces gardneri]|uniref:DUF6221 family protein n=1 Tax=Streptomyces gardneri TaxID=66892 RepID=UPI0036AB2D10